MHGPERRPSPPLTKEPRPRSVPPLPSLEPERHLPRARRKAGCLSDGEARRQDEISIGVISPTHASLRGADSSEGRDCTSTFDTMAAANACRTPRCAIRGTRPAGFGQRTRSQKTWQPQRRRSADGQAGHQRVEAGNAIDCGSPHAFAQPCPSMAASAPSKIKQICIAHLARSVAIVRIGAA